jgi:uncharacterized membrane-anchored protein
MIARTTDDTQTKFDQVLSKVPEVTLFFWIIKVLCTTVGETAADFINVNLNLGLTITSMIMGVLFIIALAVQFKTKKYTPVVYWITVVLISVFGTLVTDNLSDNLHVPLEYSTILFTVLLGITFGVWYLKEKTLSIHSIFTPRREAFYWLAILFTFALGTASGDLMAEALGFGYLTTGIIVALTIAAFAIAWRMGLNVIIAFWFIYIMTRPLGASLGDFLSQPHAHGGLALGPTITTILMTTGIIFSVSYLALSRQDVVKDSVAEEKTDEKKSKGALGQLIAVIVIVLILSVGGYYVRQGQLQAETAPTATVGSSQEAGASQSPLGDLSTFSNLGQAILTAINAGDWATANSKVNDLEYAWDNADARLKPMNPKAWTHIDGALDKVFREVRAVHPNQQTAAAALQTLLTTIANP